MARAVATHVRSPAAPWVAVGAPVLLAAAAIVAVLVRRDSSDEPESPPPPSETPPPAVLPLLGTPGRVPARAGLAVNIEEHRAGTGTVGIAEADVVFEEMVEGG
jgi:hypothetical protein